MELLTQSTTQTLNKKLNTDRPSELSKERRIQLNQLAEQALLNTGKAETENNNCLDSLLLETVAMDEVLAEVSDISGSYVDFYSDIDQAFGLLIKQNPNAFRTYQQLSRMFRVFEKHNTVTESKWSEALQILADLNTIDKERLKGGVVC
jgi:hypothetical protein